jgi:hypothetical protein
MTSFGSSSTKLFSTEDAKFPCVRIQNLQSDAGQRLNGKIGRNTTVSPYFMIPANMSRSGIDIPVQAFMDLDGFGRPGLVLYYSVHAGKDVLKKALIAHGYTIEIENAIKNWGEYGVNLPYCIVTSPCYDDNLRNNILGPKEAVFNVTKFPNECNAVFAAGIATIQSQKGTVEMGFYKGHPICKINTPKCKRTSEEDGGHILYDEDTRRQEIKIPGIRYRKLLKKANLTPVPDSDLVQVIRLHAKGENCHVMMEVLLYPSNHPMFEESGNSPVMERCGIPLVIKKVEPKSKLTHQAEYDNQWATWCMADPVHGIAPMEWQNGVGPVLIYRPGGLNFNDFDMDIVGDYLGHLQDRFGDHPEHAHRLMTPTAFQEFKDNLIQSREENQNQFLEMNG